MASSKEVHVSRKPKKPKVSQKSSQFVSPKTVSQPEVPWWKQLGGPVASSKEVEVSRKSSQSVSQKLVQVKRKPKKVENLPQVE